MSPSKSVLQFSIGPRQVTVFYDQCRRRVVVRVIVQDGKRVDRDKQPELWRELRADFLTLKK